MTASPLSHNHITNTARHTFQGHTYQQDNPQLTHAIATQHGNLHDTVSL